MHRFFVNPEEIQGERVVFSTAHSRQIARVLRLKTGQRCVVLDDRGSEMVVILSQVGAESCTAGIIETRSAVEPSTILLMMVSLTQREKFEWMLQKCTEVGAAAFQPVITSRSMVQQPEEVETKYARWRSIIREAAEQSGRGRVPELLAPARLTIAVEKATAHYQRCLIPWEGEQVRSLKEALAGRVFSRVAVLIGPEGGFSEEEVQHAVSLGFTSVTLGKRILRMETAAVVTAALILHELE
ncbi:MAG TPA: RsmE family RNA methyltransferase [Anaerolineaceae bacterium]|nr:RsmE family RNA methyltransferase [Anaerolineaceae bacterium]